MDLTETEGPGTAPGPGSAAAGRAGTGRAGTGSAGTGSAGTGGATAGPAGTGSLGTGSAGTGGATAGPAGTGSLGTGSAGTGGAGRIEVEIGELVLDGFPRIDHDRLTAAFRSELTRLVAERGVPLAADGDRALDLLAGLPPLPAGASAQRLGQALARAVHTGLSGGGRAPERGRT